MTTDREEERDLRAIAHALVADAPEAAEWDAVVTSSPPSALHGRQFAFVAAVGVVVIGVAGAAALRERGPDQTSSTGSTQTSSESVGSSSDERANSTVASEPVTPTEQTYVVAMGDFLSGIAAAHCTTIEQITEYNQWPDGLNHPLLVGDVVRIPPGSCDWEGTEPAPMVEASSALAPTIYPVVPQEVIGDDSVTGAGFAQTSWSNAPVTRALIGVIESDRLVEALLVESGPWVNDMAGTGEETTVFDQPAQIYRDADLTPNTSTVVWGTNPVIAVEGLNPMAFLQRASADFVVATSVDGAASITSLQFGDLPDGWEVIVEPAPLRRGAVTAQMSTGDGGLSIEVTTENPMLAAWTGSFGRVDVNGTPGWQYDRARQPVIWQADDITFVILTADSPALALTAARALEFVGAGAWMDTYAVEFPIFPPESPAQAPPTPFETTVP